LTSFPSTAQLLVSGEDTRLQLNLDNGTNHYLCRPYPDPKILRLGSSTATTISSHGFEIADHLRNQMAEEACNRTPTSVYNDHAERICHEIHHCCKLDKQTTVLLAESGTIAHRHALRIVTNHDIKNPWCVLMVEARETGRGVPLELCPADCDMTCTELPIRDADGMPLSTAMIDAGAIEKAEIAIKQGKKVLLVMVDQSKSGCIAPSLSCGLYLRQCFPGQVHLLLDACQFRLARKTLNDYLKHGVPVIITGSKFLAGPSFSAALLLPNCDSAPVQTSLERVLPHQTGPGLLVRWQVALASLQAFQRLEDLQISQFLQQFASAFHQRLAHSALLVPLPTSNLHRNAEPSPTEWDHMPTIFPFMLRRQSSPDTLTTYASHADALVIYQRLQQRGEPRAQLGRPMHIGQGSNGFSAGALRFCISAPMVIDAINHHRQRTIIEQAMTALDRVANKEMI